MSDREEREERTYIPAQPGFYTLEGATEIIDGKAKCHPYLNPVIAWLFEPDESDIMQTYPVTIEGVDIDYPNPVVFPDGRVEMPWDRMYASVDEWVRVQETEAQEAWEKRREKWEKKESEGK